MEVTDKKKERKSERVRVAMNRNKIRVQIKRFYRDLPLRERYIALSRISEGTRRRRGGVTEYFSVFFFFSILPYFKSVAGFRTRGDRLPD